MFADTALAARIEGAEARLSADIGQAIVTGGRVKDCFVQPLAGGVAVFVGPDSPVNKAIGLGFGPPLDAAAIEALEARFAAVGATLQVEVSTLADPAWHAALSGRGYAVAGFEHVLGQPLDDEPGSAPERDSGITIAESPAADAAAWMDVLVSGFAAPDEVAAQAAGQEYPREAIERVFAEMTSVPGFRRYAAQVDGARAGAAGLRESDGIAQLCGAATLPAFRRRGVQSALLVTRLRDARTRGCTLAVVTTAPGSKSQQNAQRQGFALLYARALYVRPPATPSPTPS